MANIFLRENSIHPRDQTILDARLDLSIRITVLYTIISFSPFCPSSYPHDGGKNAYPVCQIFIQHRNPPGGKIIKKERKCKSCQWDSTGDKRIASTPYCIPTVVDVRREREQPTAIRLALVRGILLERCPLELGDGFSQDSNEVCACSDGNKRICECQVAWRNGAGRLGGHGPDGEEGINRVEDGIESGDCDCGGDGGFLLRNEDHGCDLLDAAAQGEETDKSVVGLEGGDACRGKDFTS